MNKPNKVDPSKRKIHTQIHRFAKPNSRTSTSGLPTLNQHNHRKHRKIIQSSVCPIDHETRRVRHLAALKSADDGLRLMAMHRHMVCAVKTVVGTVNMTVKTADRGDLYVCVLAVMIFERGLVKQTPRTRSKG